MTAEMTFSRFDYRVYAGDRPAPALQVELVGVNGATIPSMALVDSGAEWSQLPMSLAKPLGADTSALPEISSQTGGGIVDGNLWWNEPRDGLVVPEPRVRVMGHDVPLCPVLSTTVDIVVLARIHRWGRADPSGPERRMTS